MKTTQKVATSILVLGLLIALAESALAGPITTTTTTTAAPTTTTTAAPTTTTTTTLPGGKVALCHKDKKTIRVSAKAVPAHLRHGDELGACD